MARKDNRINMPMSTAGITRYFDDYKTKFTFQPGHIILLCIIVVAIIVVLHMYGNNILGLA